MNTPTEAAPNEPQPSDARISRALKPCWNGIVYNVLESEREPVSLYRIYSRVEKAHPQFTSERRHWKARVRATLQASREFVRTAHGHWDLAERHPKEYVEALERERRERYPLRPKTDS